MNRKMGNIEVETNLGNGSRFIDEILSSIPAGVKKTDKKIILSEESRAIPEDSIKIGNEGSVHGNTVFLRVRGGGAVILDEMDSGIKLYVKKTRLFPFILPFILSNIAGQPVAPVHACSVQVQGEGVLVAGSGGSARTGVILRMIGKESRFISDDFSLVTEGGDIISASPGLWLSCEITPDIDLKDNLARIIGSITFKQRIQRALLSTVQKILPKRDGFPARVAGRVNKKLSISTYLDSREIWGKDAWQPATRLYRVYLVQVSTGKDRCKEISRGLTASRLRVINRIELNNYLEMVRVINFARPSLGLALGQAFAGFEKTLVSALGEARCFEVKGSRNYIQRTIPEIEESRSSITGD